MIVCVCVCVLVRACVRACDATGSVVNRKIEPKQKKTNRPGKKTKTVFGLKKKKKIIILFFANLWTQLTEV